jgi:amino acid adenylation domain-containing protein
MEHATPRLFRQSTMQELPNSIDEQLGGGGLAQKTSSLLNELSRDEGVSSRPITPEERAKVLAWGRNPASYPVACVHHLFEEQAEKSPNAVALTFQGAQLSYEELNRRANQLARFLRESGVKPDTRAAICVERGFEMIVAALAVLKAGGAYVPLDPAYPLQRLRFMLDDSEPVVLLTQGNLKEMFSGIAASVPVIDLSESEGLWNQQPDTNLDRDEVGVTPEHLAYVVYTSGSTGLPKGAMVEHRGLSNLAAAQIHSFGVESGSRVLQFSSFSFDACASEIMMTLLRGASLHLIPQKEILAGEPLALFLEQHRITHVTLAPAVLSTLPEPSRIAPTVTLILAGDTLNGALASRWAQGRRLFNAYGPTEATVCATVYECQSEQQGNPPIGRPIANTRVYILNKDGELVPPAVTGELYIGGAGVARGYLNRTELTAERFLKDPFAEESGARMYRTGDLGRWLADGNIEFLGRNDFQVKIRGYRIELGEIEAILTEYPGVREAIVIAREDAPGEKRLVAYYTGEIQLDAAALRTHLSEKLPDYLVPAAYVRLSALPLTVNGKLDRSALPVPSAAAYAIGEYVAPLGETETAIAAMWAEVLGVERVGRFDNFFNLGGDSLLAMRVAARIRMAFDIEFSVRKMFQYPAVATLSEWIESQPEDRKPQTQVLIPRRTLGASAPIPMSYAQMRFWTLHQLQPDDIGYRITLAFRLRGNLDLIALESSIQEIVARHSILRATYSFQDGELIQVIGSALPGMHVLTLVDLSAMGESEREQEALNLAAAGNREPFDLEQGPLFHNRIFRLSSSDHLLVISMHHSIADGSSLDVLCRELSELYRAKVGGEDPHLAEVPVQYSDFAWWQRDWLQRAEAEEDTAYWQLQLEDASSNIKLPADKTRPGALTHRGDSRCIVTGKKLAVALRELSRQEDVTLFMTLMAAFQTLLFRHNGQEEFIVGVPISTRDRQEFEGLIGCFLNMLPFRADLSGRPGFRRLLRRVRQTALEAFDHDRLPIEKQLEVWRQERSVEGISLFKVLFNELNFAKTALSLDGLSVEPVMLPEEGANAELELYAEERGDEIELRLVYQCDLFSSEAVDGLLRQFRTLLEGIVSNPDESIIQYPLFDTEEKSRLLADYRRNFPAQAFREVEASEIEQSISERFEQQVERDPNRLAVHTVRFHWTYGQLNQMANHIAHALISAGGTMPECVTLLFEHDAPMIAAILGVLKAGKTYVPLEPDHPAERLNQILADSGARVLLTQGACFEIAQGLSHDRLQILDIDGLGNNGHADNLDLKVSPDTAAYLLYTSGSTGRPKGVVQSHRNVLHFMRAYTNNLHLNANDRLTLFSSYGFDAAVMDIFGALLNGAALYPVDVKRVPPQQILKTIAEGAITVFHSTPTLYRYLVSLLQQNENLPGVRLVVLGGEEVVGRDVEVFREHFSKGCIFVNGFGPTESTLALQNFISHDSRLQGPTVPLGYPVDETEVLLLDDLGNDDEFCGEIAIRSRHLALGYWKQPELTLERFLPDRKGSDQRIYRTGDLARRRPDGMLEYLGRKDQQLKIRGNRIELAEIEAVLGRHPGVGERVVAATENGDGEKQLVAYVAPIDPSRPPEIAELRDLVEKALPAFMMPAAFVMLQRLPLTPNGKVDRKALPPPGRSDMASSQIGEYVAPRNETEKRLADIFSKVLDLPHIGVNDDFFDLGGHSLSAMRAVSLIGSQLNIQLPVRVLFQAQTIAQIAAYVQKQRAGAARETSEEWPICIPIQRNGAKTPLFCVARPNTNAIGYLFLSRRLGADQPVYGLQRQMTEDALFEFTEEQIRETASEYIRAMRAVQPNGPYLLVGYCHGAYIAFEITRQLEAQRERVAMLGMLDVWPEENTRNRRRFFAQYYVQRILRSFRGNGNRDDSHLPGQAENGLRRSGKVLPRPIRAIKENPLWRIYWPGQDFKPAQVSAKIVVFRVHRQPLYRIRDRALGWGNRTTGMVEVEEIEGDHHTFMREPYVQNFAERLKAQLESVLHAS